MTKVLKFVGLAGLVCIAILLLFAGCGGGKITGGGEAQYTLELVVEKNIDDGQDYLYAKFLRNGIAIVDGYIDVNGDSLPTSASGQVSKMYSSDHFTHGATVQITAVDPDSSFQYSGTVVMPSAFAISVTPEAARIWQPGDGNIRVELTTLATPTTGYFVSITPSDPNSTAPGLTEIVNTGQLYTFSPFDAFYNLQTNELQDDVYLIRMIAYNQTFVKRPNANYKSPSITFPQTISASQISGKIAAVVVAAHDQVSAMPLP